MVQQPKVKLSRVCVFEMQIKHLVIIINIIIIIKKKEFCVFYIASLLASPLFKC